MFTGLIENVGTLAGIERQGRAASLKVKCALPMQEIALGESIAVNGACLTVEKAEAGVIRFHCLAETLSRTNLGGVAVGGKLNLERALKVGDRLGGHIVTGHVDFTAKVIAIQSDGSDIEMKIEIPAGQGGYFVEKGSVAVNGVSLTIAKVADDSFTVCLIPTTRSHTNLDALKTGDSVNIETDILGKYVLKSACYKKSNVTMEMLKEAGF